VNEVRGVVVKNADPEADMDLGAPKDRRREYIRDAELFAGTVRTRLA
jgi:hypothetical protein